MGLGRLTVRSRIFVGFGLLVVLGLAMAGFTLLQLGGIGTQVRKMDGLEGNVARVMEVSHALETMRRAIIRYRFDRDAPSLEEMNEAGQRSERLLTDAGAVTLSEARRQTYREAIDQLHAYQADVSQFLGATKAADTDKAKLFTGGDALTARTAQMVETTRGTDDPRQIDAAGKAEVAVLLVRIANWRFLATQDPNGLTTFTGNVGKAEAAIGVLEGDAPDVRARTAPVREALAAYATAFNSYSTNTLKAQKLYEGTTRSTMLAMQKQLAAAEASLKEDFATSVSTTDGIMSGTTWLQTILAAISFIAGSGLALVIGRGITVPLGRMTEAMTKLAAGDKAIDIPARENTDEIGDMARAVEVFRHNAIEADLVAAEQDAARAARARRQDKMDQHTQEFGDTISGVMTSLAGSAAGMRRASDAMSQAASAVHEQATVTAGGATRSSMDLTAVAGAVEQLSASVDEISRQVATAASVTRQAVNRAETSQGTMRGLAEATSRIGDVVHLISNIAGQTNLLALNATIEAARAGEAGKGFAVVASEVKLLAAQTAKATAEISGQIETVRGVTGDAVSAMTEIGEIIGKMDEIAAAIAAAVQEQGATTREIANSIQAVSGATSETAQSMARVVEVADSAGTASRDVQAGSGDIAREAETLRTKVDEFLTTVREDSGERRRFERISGDGVKATLRIAGRAPVQAAIKDLSGSGMALVAPAVPVGTQVEVELPNAGGSVTGRVTRAEAGVIAIAFDEDATSRTRVERAMQTLGAADRAA